MSSPTDQPPHPQTNPPENTVTDQPAVDRIPVARSVIYAVRGVPEVAEEFNPERTIVPTELTLHYRAAPDSQVGRVSAYVKGWWKQDGKRIPMDKPVGRWFYGGPDGWPEWLAEEVRLHDPDGAPAAPDVWIDGHPQMEAIAAAVWEQCGRSDSGTCVEDDPRNIAVAAYAAVLPLLPAPVDRAAVLNEAAERVTAHAAEHFPDEYDQYADRLADELRRMADEAQPTEHADEIERLRTENARMRHELEVMYGGAFDSRGSKQPAAGAQQDGAQS